MARPRNETNLKAKALNRYEVLLKKRDGIDEELKGLENYLKAVGEIRARRGRRKKAESGASGRQPASKGTRKSSATETILSLIGKHGEGISIDQIMKGTGFGRLTVNGVLNRMKKEGKVKAVKRGVYAKA